MVTENAFPAVADAGAATEKCVAAPGTKVTCAVCVTAVAPTVAVYVTVCVVVAVTVKVATPDAFVVPETVVIVDEPPPCASDTAWAPTGLPKASRAVTVIVELATPLATTVPGDAETVDSAALTAPAVNDPVAAAAMLAPSSVAEIVAVPATVDDVSDAVYVPFALSVTAPSVPAVVDSAIAPALTARFVPA